VPKTTKLTLAAATLALTIGLTGCGSVVDEVEKAVSGSSGEATSTTEKDAATGFEYPIADTVDKDALTPINSTHKVGDTIVVPISGKLDGSDDTVYTRAFDVTLTSVNKGTPADLANYELDGAAVGAIPYYVSYSAKKNSGTENTSPSNVTFSSDEFSIETKEEENTPIVLDVRGFGLDAPVFEPCPAPESDFLSTEEADAGKTLTGCLVMLLDPKTKFKEISYSPDGFFGIIDETTPVYNFEVN
jgi:hypothetical protein